MARRRSLNRRWSRRSINESAVLDQDSNYVDQEDDTFWRHLPDQTRYSTRSSVNACSEAFLNSNSRIIDDDDIEATEWWNHLHKTSQDLVVPKTTARTQISQSDLANVSNATSHSSAHSITKAIKKKRVMLRAKRKSSGNNPFSQALDSSDMAIESEPISALKRKDISQNLSRSVEEEVRQSRRSKASIKSSVKYSPNSTASTDTEKRVKARPALFRRPKRKSSSAFDKILLEDNSMVGPSQSLNTNTNTTVDDGNKVQEIHEDTNKTKEFMTQTRSPFDKIRRSSRKLGSNVIIESQEDKNSQEISQTSKTQRTSQKSKDDSVNDEISEDVSEIMDTSMRNRKKNSHEQSKNNSKSFTLQVSDKRTSEDDRSSPIRSRRRLQISSSSSPEKEVDETRISNRLSQQINDKLSNQNDAEFTETIQNESEVEKRQSELSTNPKFNLEEDNLSNQTSQTGSISETQKSGYQSSGTQREPLRSQSLLYQDESANYDSEGQVEFEVAKENEDSNNIVEKSVQTPVTRLSSNKIQRSLKRQVAEVSQDDDENEIESSLRKKRSIPNIRSSKQTMRENSFSNDMRKSSFKKQRISNNKNSNLSKQLSTQKIPLVDENDEHADLQNNIAEEIPKSSKKKQSQLNSSMNLNKSDKTNESQMLLRSRRTEEPSVSYRDEEQISDQENGVTENSQESSKNRQTQSSSVTDEDEDERESEPADERENITEEIQESIKQRPLSSIHSISRKLFTKNLEDGSSAMTESSEKSRDSNRSIRNIDPSAYELPDRNRSNSYSESDAEDVHRNLGVVNDEPMQSISSYSKNLSGPSIRAQTPLPSASTDQSKNLFKKPKPSNMNTLHRYFLNSKNNLGQSEDTLLSQEQLQTLGDKLKKIKEKTDEITKKEVKRTLEKTSKIQNSVDIKSPVRNNVMKKNKTLRKPVNKAYVVDGVVYKQPKLPRPQKWVTNRLYKFLWKQMEQKYDLGTRKKSENFVNYLSDVVKFIGRRKKFENYEEDLDKLINKMAELGIIKTRMDFYNFCSDFLPYSFRVKVTPMLMPGNVRNIPFRPEILTIPIINKQ